MHNNKPAPVVRRQHFASGIVPPRPTALMRALRLSLTILSEGVRPALRHPQVFKNAPDPLRSCPTDRLALMLDDALDALRADQTLSGEQKLEQALSLPRTLEAHIRARLAPAPVQSLVEHGLRVSRTDAHEDATLAEFLAHPHDPAIAMRAADMARREAREKVTFADHVMAFFTRTHRGSAA